MSDSTSQRVAIAPITLPPLVQAVAEAGATLVGPDEADVLVWLGVDPKPLAASIESNPGLRWVQLPLAGIESLAAAFTPRLAWTCAKGAFSANVAEHGVLLMLAACRDLQDVLPRRTWGPPSGRSPRGTHALLLGGGGIAEWMVRMLEPLGVTTSVIRKHVTPVPGALRTVGLEALDDELPLADWVVVTWALTQETAGVIDAQFVGKMKDDAWIVNLARGRHIVTKDLVAALDAGTIGGAALDVTDPEPLPDDHPLWQRRNVLITPHVANTWAMGLPQLAERLKENLLRDQRGETLLGLVDVELGY